LRKISGDAAVVGEQGDAVAEFVGVDQLGCGCNIGGAEDLPAEFSRSGEMMSE